MSNNQIQELVDATKEVVAKSVSPIQEKQQNLETEIKSLKEKLEASEKSKTEATEKFEALSKDVEKLKSRRNFGSDEVKSNNKAVLDEIFSEAYNNLYETQSTDTIKTINKKTIQKIEENSDIFKPILNQAGIDTRLMKSVSISGASDTAGIFLPSQVLNPVEVRPTAMPLYDMFDKITVMSREVKLPIVSEDDSEYKFGAEGVNFQDVGTGPVYKFETLKLSKLQYVLKITTEDYNDGIMPSIMGQYLLKYQQRKFQRKLELLVTHGDSKNQSAGQGLLTHFKNGNIFDKSGDRNAYQYGKVGYIPTNNPGVIDGDDLMNLSTLGLHPDFMNGAMLVMNSNTLNEIKKLKDQIGQYHFIPQGTFADGRVMPASLFGIPIVISDWMPNIAVNNVPIVLCTKSCINTYSWLFDMVQPFATTETNNAFYSTLFTSWRGSKVINTQEMCYLKVS